MVIVHIYAINSAFKIYKLAKAMAISQQKGIQMGLSKVLTSKYFFKIFNLDNNIKISISTQYIMPFFKVPPPSDAAQPAVQVEILKEKEQELIVRLIADNYFTSSIAQTALRAMYIKKNKAIADSLFLETETVKSYFKIIHKKLNVHNRKEFLIKMNQIISSYL